MSTVPARLYTPSQAAAISGVGVKAIHNAIDKRIVGARKPRGTGSRSPRSLTVDDLLKLKLWYAVGDVLSQERRERLFAAIHEQPRARTVKADDLLIVDVAEARRQIAVCTRDLEAAEAMVKSAKDVMGGEPVFKGTRVPVRLIAAMLAEGVDERDILEGYPALDARQLDLSRIWAAAYPSRGRPRSLKDRGFTLKSTRTVSLGDGGPA